MTETKKQVENLFRYEYGKIIGVLINKFGPSNLERIEDAVQDALLKAMQVWGYKNLPDNPTSWLYRVATNNLIDVLRRDKKILLKGDDTTILTENHVRIPEIVLESAISDSQLKMIFACCHPSLSVDYQIILSLKLIGGFGNGEIAKALLKKEDSVAKSYTRAKRQLKSNITTLDIPIEIGLQSRLSIVLRVIYLLFSEGYASSTGSEIIKRDICLEAIRLALLLSENEYCNRPNVNALLALMCFHTSRFDARVNENGELVDLEHQDRTKYDNDLIAIGIEHLEKASKAVLEPSNYHLEAAVSYYHCIAKTFELTNWNSILNLYNLQLKRQYSPVVELNRIVPYYKVNGAKKAMGKLLEFESSTYFKVSVLYYAIKAELLLRLGSKEETLGALKAAIDLTENEMEQKHFLKKMVELRKVMLDDQ
ncbi:RNA polymerase subunit sigma-24 [Arenibacter sp. N53]|uniref:RNA polymerase sigma factor n=1 Tax=Arenibacter TaxID=178469 RepID=UPI000CD48269|nr:MULTISPECIES: sigma-70 family RNA polymerase sigma factor [Arenibacter]MCM4150101.1 RNA polymerase subunit sigma-24 [Arenibacter sp. N53]